MVRKHFNEVITHPMGVPHAVIASFENRKNMVRELTDAEYRAQRERVKASVASGYRTREGSDIVSERMMRR